MPESDKESQALAALKADLADVATEQATGISERRAASITLVSLYSFLIRAELPLGAQIVGLITALEALDAGTVLPLVKPKVRRGNRPITEGERIARAVAAAALELRYRELKKAGEAKPLQSAAEWVAREIRDWPELPYSKETEDQSKLDRGRIKKWRSDFIEAPDSDAADIYRFLTTRTPLGTAAQLLETEPGQWGFATKKSQ